MQGSGTTLYCAQRHKLADCSAMLRSIAAYSFSQFERKPSFSASTRMVVYCRLCCDSGAFVKMGSGGVARTHQNHAGGGGIALRQKATKEGGVSKKCGGLRVVRLQVSVAVYLVVAHATCTNEKVPAYMMKGENPFDFNSPMMVTSFDSAFSRFRVRRFPWSTTFFKRRHGCVKDVQESAARAAPPGTAR